MGAAMPIVSFICAALVLILLPLYWRTRNVAVLSAILWLAICNIARGINTAIWIDNSTIKYKVWCDISGRIIIGGNFALPSSIFCICRFLAQVASPRNSLSSASENRRRMVFDLVMCVVLPMVMIALYHIVQTNRFDIWEEIGCKLPLYKSVPALFIVYMPTITVSIGALAYAAISLRWFIYRRARVLEVLQSSHSGLSTTLYLRLIIHSVVQIFYLTALTLLIVITHIIPELNPWIGWDNVHSDWQRISQRGRADIPLFAWRCYLIVWYMVPLSSVIFFCFFGFRQESREEYVGFFRWVFRIKPKPSLAPSNSASTDSSFKPPRRVKLPIETSMLATTQETSDSDPSTCSWSSYPKEQPADARVGFTSP
ncbi:Pheromone B beta 1 receptor [Ceratobasidium theobromae]|uniref:Pheromone B beta 1 receptor n=1 Tax=Ceratobasidium theobromae TaxID=1582974 RepID=A0A5N5QB46_9AGAM|nr:Pheromone B beta 1 receptor [Ceratobasidium theobromae]